MFPWRSVGVNLPDGSRQRALPHTPWLGVTAGRRMEEVSDEGTVHSSPDAPAPGHELCASGGRGRAGGYRPAGPEVRDGSGAGEYGGGAARADGGPQGRQRRGQAVRKADGGGPQQGAPGTDGPREAEGHPGGRGDGRGAPDADGAADEAGG